MSAKRLLLILGAIYIGVTILIVALTGWHGHGSGFQPQNEFKLDTWVNLGVLSINKAVLYLFLAGVLTTGSMLYIARRMRQHPNRVQTAVEIMFGLMRDNIVFGNMDRDTAAK